MGNRTSKGGEGGWEVQDVQGGGEGLYTQVDVILTYIFMICSSDDILPGVMIYPTVW